MSINFRLAVQTRAYVCAVRGTVDVLAAQLTLLLGFLTSHARIAALHRDRVAEEAKIAG